MAMDCRMEEFEARRGFVTRRVPGAAMAGLDSPNQPLRPGDLVLAEITAIGQHQALELPTGRRKLLNVGERVVLACGARYAPDQFHAAEPELCGPANLVAAGGIAGRALSRHSRMKEATRIQIVARIHDRVGRPVNVLDYALPTVAPANVPIIAVAGTSMNAGKTTICAALVKGFRAAGLTPGYVKATGTGSGGDVWELADAGAAVTLDFTDAGHATTYHVDPNLLVTGALSLAAHAASMGADVVVMEIADGLLQQETAALLTNDRLRRAIAGVVFAGVDSMGAVAGASWLEEHGHHVVAVAGAFTQSPLAMREFELATGRTAWPLGAIADGSLAVGMAERLSPFGLIVRSLTERVAA